MKPIPALLLSLTLCTTLGATGNASEINMSWQWQSTDGQRKHFQLTTDDQVMAASRHEMSLLEASLTNPLETLYAYISPRPVHRKAPHSPHAAPRSRRAANRPGRGPL